jgi:hypothetical protein
MAVGGREAAMLEAPTVQRNVTDDLELLLEIMPPAIRQAIDRSPDREDLLEVVLDLGRLPEARFPGQDKCHPLGCAHGF